MEKLSIQKIQNDLLEAEEARKVHYDTLKSTTAPKAKEVGTPANPSTKITKIKQITVTPGKLPTSGKGKPSIPAGKDGKEVVDTMGRGIFNKTMKSENSPKKPAVSNMAKPNQSTKLKQVTAKTNEASEKLNFIKKADDAASIVDRQGRGIFKNTQGAATSPSKPSVAAGPSTEKRPALTQKKADMNRNPKHSVKDPVVKDTMKMPSDAPKKPTWGSVKGGVVVEVNGKKKAQFDIISETVLSRMVENYQSVGYEVTVRPLTETAWKRDRALFNLIRESVDAKHNGVMESAKGFRKDAFKHFYSLVQGSMNGLYESQDEFLSVAREVFKVIESKVEAKYLSELEMFEGIVRVQTTEGLEDVEIMTEATSPEMAVRQVQKVIAEEYGLGATIKHIFIDGTKIDLKAVAPWAPSSVMEAKKEIPDFIQAKIDAKKGKKKDDSKKDEEPDEEDK